MHYSSHLKIKSNFLFPRYNLLLFFFLLSHWSLIHSQPFTLSTAASLSTFHSLDVTDTGTTRHHRPPTLPSLTQPPQTHIADHPSSSIRRSHSPSHHRPTSLRPRPQPASRCYRPSLFSLCCDWCFFVCSYGFGGCGGGG